jgi:uncharacterized protein with ATP-grasp and redox domains
MRPIPYCLPEIAEMVFAAARLVSEDVFIHKRVIAKALGAAFAADDEDYSQDLALIALRAAYAALGVKDPYENEKARINRVMLGLGNFMHEYLTASSNQFAAAVKLSLAANGEIVRKRGREELENLFSERLAQTPAIDQTEEITVLAAKAENIIFIADGAGEIIADKSLISELRSRARVETVVAKQAILARATAADAEAAGLGQICSVVDAGADMLGLSIGRAGTDFRQRFNAADLVVAKGAFNFQTLKNCGREVFCLLQVESADLAEEIGVPTGSGVIKKIG